MHGFSNIFALLGLRALYFAVAGVMRSFHYLHFGFASIIGILGIKMLLSDVYKPPIGASLGLIVVILTIAVIGPAEPRHTSSLIERCPARYRSETVFCGAAGTGECARPARMNG
jgi:predicted tellurium resistance membrane protein TerC